MTRYYFTALLIGVVLLSSATGIAQYAAAQPLQQGNVIVSIGNSRYEVHDGSTGAVLFTIDCSSVGASTETTGSFTDTVNGFFYGTMFQADNVCRTDLDGNSPTAFGGPYSAHPESILKDASGNIFVGQADGTADVLKYAPDGTLLSSFNVATGDRGSDWIELAGDGCTLFYTSEGDLVKRYDICTDTQLTDFASGLPEPCFALRILSDGGALVACFPSIQRLDSSGTIVDTYDTPTEDAWFALNLDPDGTSFWSAGIFSGTVRKFDIDSGAVLLEFTPASFTTVAGLSVVGEITQLNDPCNDVDDNGNNVVDEGQVGVDDNNNGVEDEPFEACPTPPPQAVGGEILGLDMTTLVVAGVFANALWIVPVVALVGAGAALAAIGIKRRNMS